MIWLCALLWLCGAVPSYTLAYQDNPKRPSTIAVLIIVAVWPVAAVIGFVGGMLRRFDLA